MEEVREHEYILTTGRYVGIEEVENEDEELFAKSRYLEDEIRENLGGIGYEF